MLHSYLPVLVFLIIAIIFALTPIVLSLVLAPRKINVVKAEAYECGFAAFGSAKRPFKVRFYLVALLFLLFDVETVFFFPWAVSLRHIGWFGFFSMLGFIVILAVGFIYEWKNGVLDWK